MLARGDTVWIDEEIEANTKPAQKKEELASETFRVLTRRWVEVIRKDFHIVSIVVGPRRPPQEHGI